MSSTSQAWTDRDEGVDLRAAVITLWNCRWWIVASAFVFTAVFAAVAFSMTPVYRASTVLVPANTEGGGFGGGLGSMLGQLGGLTSIAGINLGEAGSSKEEALAVLRSRQFIEVFIKDFNLMPELFPKKWDSERGTWKADVTEPPTFGKAYRMFSENICKIQQDKKTGLVTVQVDWRDREQAAVWANELIKRLNAEMRARAIGTADASVGYLEKELNTTSVVATREAINRLIEAQIKQRMLANVTQEYAFRVVDKAMAPDRDDRLRPKKLMMLIAGFAIGTGLAIASVLMLAPASRRVA